MFKMTASPVRPCFAIDKAAEPEELIAMAACPWSQQAPECLNEHLNRVRQFADAADTLAAFLIKT